MLAQVQPATEAPASAHFALVDVQPSLANLLANLTKSLAFPAVAAKPLGALGRGAGYIAPRNALGVEATQALARALDQVVR